MPSGRKPKPNVLKVINNNPGGRPLPEELEIEGELGGAPDWFSEEELLAWNNILEAAPPGLLTSVDHNLLVIYCQACAEHKEASLMLKSEGYVVESLTGAKKKNEWVVVKNRAAEIMLKTGSEMGFTPASRSKVSASGGSKKGNKFSGNGKRSAS